MAPNIAIRIFLFHGEHKRDFMSIPVSLTKSEFHAEQRQSTLHLLTTLLQELPNERGLCRLAKLNMTTRQVPIATRDIYADQQFIIAYAQTARDQLDVPAHLRYPSTSIHQ
jgi:hypothetical protein